MNKKNIIILFLLSLTVRLLFLLVVYKQPIKYYTGSDAYNYENIANNLIHYGVFSGETQEPLLPDIYRTPIYPLFIAGVFLVTNGAVLGVVILQLVLGSATAAVIPILANKLKLSSSVGWVAGAFIALDPLIIFTSYQMITETMFLGFLVSGFLFLAIYLQGRNIYWLAGSALVFGLASLTRPISQFLPIALIPLFFLATEKAEWRQMVKNALLFVILCSCITYTWAFRNYSETGLWSLSAIGDKNLLYYRALEVVTEEEGLSDEEAETLFNEYIQSNVREKGLTIPQEIDLMRKKAFEIFRQYPATTIKVHAVGLVKVLANPGLRLICVMTQTAKIQVDSEGTVISCEAEDQNGVVAQLIGKFSPMNLLGILSSIIEIIMLFGVYIGAGFGSWKLFQEKKWGHLYFLILPILYLAILSAGGESVARFRIPMLPFLALLTGIGVNKFHKSTQVSTL